MCSASLNKWLWIIEGELRQMIGEQVSVIKPTVTAECTIVLSISCTSKYWFRRIFWPYWWYKKRFVLSTRLLWLQPHFHRRNVASLALFYRYFHANRSSDLANCVPLLLPRPRCTRLASSFHSYSVHLPNARVNQYSQSFIPFSGKLCNFPPVSVFLPAYDLNCFKREVSRHLSHSSFGYWILDFPGTGTTVGPFDLFLLPLADFLLQK